MNQKILKVIQKLEKKSQYEEKHKEELSEKTRMLAITQETGKFYNQILKAIDAKRILEIGLSHGYSTLWFADAMLSNMENDDSNTTAITTNKPIITIENDPAKIKIAQENFKEAGVSEFIDIRQGIGIDVLRDIVASEKKMSNTSKRPLFDFMFIDADKNNSIKYFEMCLPMIRKKGIIAADNVLDMKEMISYTKHLRKRNDVQTITLPIGWGQEFSIKL